MRIARLGEVEVVADLAELLALCAQLRADGGDGDGAAWSGTIVLLGSGDPRLADARAALREHRDPGPLAAVAEAEVGVERVARALALHAERVE